MRLILSVCVTIGSNLHAHRGGQSSSGQVWEASQFSLKVGNEKMKTDQTVVKQKSAGGTDMDMQKTKMLIQKEKTHRNEGGERKFADGLDSFQNECPHFDKCLNFQSIPSCTCETCKDGYVLNAEGHCQDDCGTTHHLDEDGCKSDDACKWRDGECRKLGNWWIKSRRQLMCNIFLNKAQTSFASFESCINDCEENPECNYVVLFSDHSCQECSSMALPGSSFSGNGEIIYIKDEECISNPIPHCCVGHDVRGLASCGSPEFGWWSYQRVITECATERPITGCAKYGYGCRCDFCEPGYQLEVPTSSNHGVTCTGCKDKYTQNCLKNNFNDCRCESCESGYTPDVDGKCEACDRRAVNNCCKHLNPKNPTNQNCKFCMSNYQLTDSGSCNECPTDSNCIKRKGNSCNCEYCKLGSDLINGTCTKCPHFDKCQKFRSVHSCICETCTGSYVLNADGDCQECENSSTETDCCIHSTGGNCTLCKYGFRLQNGSCNDCRVSNCDLYGPHCWCLECISGYTMREPGLPCERQWD